MKRTALWGKTHLLSQTRTIRHKVAEPLSGLILSGRLSPGRRYIFDGKLTEK